MKAYFVGDDETGFAYVLNNRKEALALRAKVSSEMDIPFTEVRVREIKKAIWERTITDYKMVGGRT